MVYRHRQPQGGKEVQGSKMMPKASVVMTVYNGEEFLEQAIESILSQTVVASLPR